MIINLKKVVNSAIILAGGIGQRMHSDIPKQFIRIKDKMIIDFSMSAFYNNKNIDEIIIVCHEDWVDKIKLHNDKTIIVKGGQSRTESSMIGINQCSNSCKNVLIHDAARPFLSNNLINLCVANLIEYDAVVPVISSQDSLIDITCMKYLNRKIVKSIQTPQAFRYSKIAEAYINNHSTYNDDLSALLGYNKNIKCKFINGEKRNIKITNNEDLLLFNL